MKNKKEHTFRFAHIDEDGNHIINGNIFTGEAYQRFYEQAKELSDKNLLLCTDGSTGELNHNPSNVDLKNVIGNISNVKMKDDGIYGELHPLSVKRNMLGMMINQKLISDGKDENKPFHIGSRCTGNTETEIRHKTLAFLNKFLVIKWLRNIEWVNRGFKKYEVIVVVNPKMISFDVIANNEYGELSHPR